MAIVDRNIFERPLSTVDTSTNKRKPFHDGQENVRQSSGEHLAALDEDVCESEVQLVTRRRHGDAHAL